MDLLLSTGFVTLFVVDYYLMYSKTVQRYPELNEKSRAHILSIKASITLFLVSLYFNYKWVTSNFDKDIYLGKINRLVKYNICPFFVTTKGGSLRNSFNEVVSFLNGKVAGSGGILLSTSQIETNLISSSSSGTL